MKCKYEHDGDCCNVGADQYMRKCKKPCEFIWSLSNADHIRSMTDEELAEFMSHAQEPCSSCELAETDGACTSTLCENAVLRWLKKTYKEET